ncbi:CvfB family protein [Anaerosporobacter faecicola]|uniref:CvfB family protein n=1 Tax=Anaerosporobacter faecicola TaxID=2718714 RepID=UPI00143AE005|nr:S1-like domain-containing RNA-binding protein [Anaerosporobacter faecicola]
MNLGEIQTLKLNRFVEFGAYLVDLDSNANGTSVKNGEVLLPKKQLPTNAKEGDHIEVFLYKDSEDRMIATTTIPPITLNKLAVLPVKEVGAIGAFLDWGLTKDLLLPFKQQTVKVQEGDQILVALYIDKSKRLCATMKVYDYLDTNSPYQKDDKVEGIVYELSRDFGTFVAVDQKYSAMLMKNESFASYRPGDHIQARVVSVREDGKLNLSTRDKVYIQLDEDASLIYKKLQENDGFLPYNDKSDPELIKSTFNLSKNAFKRAIGRLLKNKQITIEDDGIHLV